MSGNKITDFFAELQVRIQGLQQLKDFEKSLDRLEAKARGLEKSLGIKPSNSIKAATKDQDKLTQSVSRTTKAVKGQGDAYSQHFNRMQAQAQAFGKKVEAIQARHTKATSQTQVVRRKLLEVADKVKPRIRVRADGNGTQIVDKQSPHEALKGAIRERLAGVQAQGINKLSRLESSLSRSRIQQAADVTKAEADAKAASFKTEVTRQKYYKAAQAQYQKDMEKLAKAESKAQAQAAKQQENAQKRAAQAQRLQNALLRDKQGIQLRNAQIAAAELRGHAQRLNALAKNKSAQTRASIDSVRLQAAQTRLQATQARTQATLSRVSAGVHNSPMHAYLQGMQARAMGMVGADGMGLMGAASGVSRLTAAAGPAGLAIGALAGAAVVAGAALKGLVDRGTGVVVEGEKLKQARASFGVLAKGDQEKAGEMETQYFDTAQRLGVSYKDTVGEVVKSARTLADGGMKPDKALNLVEELSAYSKANGLPTERQNLVLTALGQIANKGQLMSEELKSQIGESLPGSLRLAGLAYADARGVKVNPDNDKQVQQSMQTLNADMKKGDVKGDILQKWFVAFGNQLNAGANRGGMLDLATQSHESMMNRKENERLKNQIGGYNQDDGALGKARHDLDKQLIELEKSFAPLESGLSALSTEAIETTASLTKFATSLQWWAARFIPGYGYQSNKVDPADAKESLERSRQLASLQVQDEKDPTKKREAGLFEQRDMYVDFLRESRRVRGGTLTDREEAFAANRAVTTPRDQLIKEMRTQLTSQDVRDRSLKLVDSVGRASESLNRSMTDRPLVLDPKTNILSPENASRLLQNLPQQPESATYWGQVMRDRDDKAPTPTTVTNKTEVTIAPGAIVVNDSGSPEATAQAVQDALSKAFQKTAAGIGEETQ